jgi:alkanesulfonate monooxygenase SsuD/methylene tetrahydromethanopterin reductase-like flavin-dependent oxidoreductase (luciferase family)
MQIGFNLPISGPLSSPEIVTRIAQHGEALGYDYLTLTDHIVLPNLRVPGYPYSESGEFFGEGPERRHEQLTTAAFIAAKTFRIRLVLAVMVVPHRPAVLAAKMLGEVRRDFFRTQAGAKASPADLGRRRERTVIASRRPVG